MIEMVDWGGTGTACCYTQRGTLCGLVVVNMGVCCAQFPGGYAPESMGLMYCLYT